MIWDPALPLQEAVSIPCQGIKILHAVQSKKKKKEILESALLITSKILKN